MGNSDSQANGGETLVENAPFKNPFSTEEEAIGSTGRSKPSLMRANTMSSGKMRRVSAAEASAEIDRLMSGAAAEVQKSGNAGLMGMCAGEERQAKSSSRKLWQRAMLEMSNNTRDLVMRAAKRVEAGQLAPEDVPAWLAQRIPRIRLLTDRILEEVWAKYDIDGNGILSHAELKELVREYLENGREEAKREIQRMLIYKFKFELNMSDADLFLFMRNPVLQEKLKDAQSMLESRFSFWLGRVDEVAEQMYQKMDRNADGTLTKQEFMMMFGNVCEEVCDTSYIKSTFLRICKVR